jgi:hypothetical protein
MPTLWQEAAMDLGIHQARWLLFQVFGLVFGVAAVGLIVG